MGNEANIESSPERGEKDVWRPLLELAALHGGQGVAPFDEPGAEVVDVHMNRHEAEVLARYWFERKSGVEEGWEAYGQIRLKDTIEAACSGDRMAELLPHVSGPFLEELKAEAGRRDAERKATHRAYDLYCERDDRHDDPEVPA
jgi:hypothetical protein